MRHVIVGASAAGLAAAESLLDVDPGAEVVLLSEEHDRPYCRPLISYWLGGETPESLLPLTSPALSRTELRLGARAASIEPAGKKVRLASGEELPYDRLLLATGAASASLGLPGEDAPNVRGFRSLEDARSLDEECRNGAARAVVLGGGLVGVKAAHALAARGVSTLLAVASSHPLSQVVDAEAGRMIAEALEDEGVEVRTGLAPKGFEASNGRVRAVAFEGGRREVCDLVVVGKGVVPRTDLLSGLGLNLVAGAPADEYLRTPIPGVWAAGDVALTRDIAWGEPRINAIWPMAVEQGCLAGRNMAGAAERYPGSVAMNSLRLGSLEIISAGMTKPTDRSCESRSALGEGRRSYRKVVTRDGRLVGMICVGAVEQAGLLVSAIRAGARLDELPFDPLEPAIHWGRYAFADRAPGR